MMRICNVIQTPFEQDVFRAATAIHCHTGKTPREAVRVALTIASEVEAACNRSVETNWPLIDGDEEERTGGENQ